MSTIDFDSLLASDELSLDDILAIESAGSEKGIYQRDLLDFVHSGKLGVPYKFSGKNAQSVKMGFNSAVDAIQKKDDVSAEDKEAVKAVEIRVRKGEKTKDENGNDVQAEYVFLINNKVVAAKRGNAPAQTEAPAETEAEPATV
jgi:hypothetical protein